MWLAAGGTAGGRVFDRTDNIGLKPVEGEVHVHDLQATLLHCLGIDHEKLTCPHQGRDFRLTDVGGRVVKEILTWDCPAGPFGRRGSRGRCPYRWGYQSPSRTSTGSSASTSRSVWIVAAISTAFSGRGCSGFSNHRAVALS